MSRNYFKSLPSPGWLLVLAPLVASFFYAPLAFGATTPNGVRVLDSLLYASFALWGCHVLVTRRKPYIPAWVFLPLLFLAALGVCHALNPKSVFLREAWQLFEIDGYIRSLPGTIDPFTTRPLVWHFGAMALGFLVMVDATVRPKIRWFLLRVVALSGLVIALVGIVQRAGGAESMLWVGPEQSGKLFFGAFRYNANAGAFLNLSWPAALVLWLRSRIESKEARGNSFDLCVLFFVVAAVFVNTSKAAQMLGLIGLIAAAVWFWPILKPQNTSRAVIAILSILFLALFSVVLLPALSLISERWEASSGSLAGRLLLYEVSGKIIADSGWFGQGPGAFRILFPFYTGYLGDRLRGIYTHAHQDYLQTIIEWGYLGFVAWFLLIGGGLFVAIRQAVRRRAQSRADLSASCSALALLLVLLHAFADFPLQIPAIQWVATFHLAVCWAAVMRTDPVTMKERRKRKEPETIPDPTLDGLS